MNLHYKNIILRHGRSVVRSRSECDIHTYFGDHKFSSPIILSNMRSVQDDGVLRTFDRRHTLAVRHRLDSADDIFEFVKKANAENWNTVSISVGVQDEDIVLLKTIAEAGLRVDFITVDVALSYNTIVENIIETARRHHPAAHVICGNGSTTEWAEYMAGLGVCGIKAGIGVSDACRTRQYTGFGSPMVSMLQELSAVTRRHGIILIADGGLTQTNGEVWIGDVAKALRFGADFVMSGSLFSACVDSPSLYHGYYGNASECAKNHTKHVEGASLNVTTHGRSVNEQLDLIEDSLRSAVSYCGGRSLEHLRQTRYYTVYDQ